MTIGPLLPGRLPNSLASARLQESLQQINRQLVRLQDQAATGQAFFLPSESPTAAIQSIALQRTIERQTHYKANINTARNFLVSTEEALDTTADAANRTKSIILEGIGQGSTPEQKKSLAAEIDALITSTLSAANAKQSGRYLFAGSETTPPPFEYLDGGVIRYNGDMRDLSSYIGQDLLLATNVNGEAGFAALSPPLTSDLNVALTPATRIADLLGGRGVALGPIQLTVDDGVNPATTATVDLTGAETIQDIQTRLQNAFPPSALTVDVDPANQNALRLSAGGSVTVSDLPGSTVARNLGIAGGPSASLVGVDLNPTITKQTKLSDLRGGLGLTDPTKSFVITNGSKSATIDVSTLDTIEDLFNAVDMANIDVAVDLNAAGNGISIQSRLSGTTMTVGENGGTTATELGWRTFTGSTRLADLNRGLGVPVDNGTTLNVTLSNGTVHPINLAGKKTIQEVITAINAVGDPNLTASLNASGNGISLADTSAGTGPFSVEANAIGLGLGIAKSLPGSGAITGDDVNPQEPPGLFNLLLNVKKSLLAGDDRELTRLDAVADTEIKRLNVVRGDVGSRQQFLDEVENRLEDQNVTLKSNLSNLFDADITAVITQLTQTASMLQSTLQIASQIQQLSLLNFL